MLSPGGLGRVLGCEIDLYARLLPAAGGGVSIAEYGIFTAPYQTRAAGSIRAETWKPEFQVQPSS